MDNQPELTEVVLALRNGSDRALTLYLEPWGEEHTFPVGARYLIVGYGPRKGSGLEAEYRDQAVIVTAWIGSSVRLYEQGKELGSGKPRPPVPEFMEPWSFSNEA